MRKFFSFFIISLLSAGCGPETPRFGAPCDKDSVCGGVCNLGLPNGMCTFACSETEPCKKGTCVVFSENAWCLPSCEQNSDCRDGYGCIDFFCAPKQPVGARCDDTTDCLPCAEQDACPSDSRLACMENVCSVPCRDQTDCVDGTFCARSSGEFWCVGIDFDTGPGNTGRDCSVESCADGLECRDFFSIEGNLQVCSHPCASDRECPPDMGCRLDFTGEKWCIPRLYCETCQLDSQCGQPADRCILTGDLTSRYCSRECDPGMSGTCPLDTECQEVFSCDNPPGWVDDCDACPGDCDPARSSFQCVVAAGSCVGDGQVCSGCFTDTDCGQDLHCILGKAAWQYTCSPGCETQEECPDGTICEDTGDSGSFCVPRTGSCLVPSGGKDTCEICTRHSDCLRGYCAPVPGDTSGFSFCLDTCVLNPDCGFYGQCATADIPGFGQQPVCIPSATIGTCPQWTTCMVACPEGPAECGEGPAECR